MLGGHSFIGGCQQTRSTYRTNPTGFTRTTRPIMEARSFLTPSPDPDPERTSNLDTQHFGCLTIKHFPAWAISLIRHHDSVKPLIVQEENHIIAVNRAAAMVGLERGMTAARAMSLCPEAALYVRDPVAEFSAWEYVLERMNRITPFMESDSPRLWFAADTEEVRMTARFLGASIGFGPHRSTAWLASIQAGAGQVLSVDEDEVDGFQDNFPVAFLEEADFGYECIEGLEMLGCATLGTARAMSERHLKLAWDDEGTHLHRLIHPEDATAISLFRPAPVIRKHFTLFTPCYDAPYVIPIVHRLVQKTHEKLKSNIVGQVRVVLHLEGHPPEHAARVLTHPTARLDALIRFAERLTEDMFTELMQSKGRVGIEKVEVILAGLLTGDMIQMSLFDRKRRQVKEAVSKVHRRFPRSLKRSMVREGAHFHEDRYSYVVWE